MSTLMEVATSIDAKLNALNAKKATLEANLKLEIANIEREKALIVASISVEVQKAITLKDQIINGIKKEELVIETDLNKFKIFRLAIKKAFYDLFH